MNVYIGANFGKFVGGADLIIEQDIKWLSNKYKQEVIKLKELPERPGFFNRDDILFLESNIFKDWSDLDALLSNLPITGLQKTYLRVHDSPLSANTLNRVLGPNIPDVASQKYLRGLVRRHKLTLVFSTANNSEIAKEIYKGEILTLPFIVSSPNMARIWRGKGLRKLGNKILFIANYYHPQKGCELIQEVIRCDVKKKYEYTLVGDFSKSDEFYEGNRIKSNVRIYEYQEDLSKFYKKNDILLVTSPTESFGFTILEAMSYGCVPVVPNTLCNLPYYNQLVNYNMIGDWHWFNYIADQVYKVLDPMVGKEFNCTFNKPKRNDLSKVDESQVNEFIKRYYEMLVCNLNLVNQENNGNIALFS